MGAFGSDPGVAWCPVLLTHKLISQTKVHSLDPVFLGDNDVCGFDIAMDDRLAVSRL